MKKSKISVVSETNNGIYVWQLPNGDFLADGLDVLSIQAQRGDLQAMAAISREARNLGYGDGRPVFQEGYRKITDEEFEIQYLRMIHGMTPDPMEEI
jgi:hypothetical protein